MSKKPRRLSPIWESYILGILQPSYRLPLGDYEARPAHSRPTAKIAMLRKVIKFHPFNLSDEEVNLARGRVILFMLGNATRGLDTQSPPWWPQDAASFVEAVKKEREEIDTYGYIGGAKQNERAEGSVEGETGLGGSNSSTLKRKRCEFGAPAES